MPVTERPECLVMCCNLPSCSLLSLFPFSVWDLLVPVSSLLFYLRMCHPFPILHCYPSSCLFPSVCSLAPSSTLRPGPGFSMTLPFLLHSFAPFLKTRNAARGPVLKSLSEENGWHLLLTHLSCASSLKELWPREGGVREWQRRSV